MEYDDPLYGTVEFTGVAEAIIENRALQRLKGVHQNGGVFLVNPDMDTTRFEHTLGTAALCKRFGASQMEVIAALVHDVGHTAFSHVADHVFGRADQEYHEECLDRILDDFALDDLLDAHGFDAERVLAPVDHSILEQDLPNICADRLDYQLRDLYKYGLLDERSVAEIVSGVTVEDGRLVARNAEIAHRLVKVSLLLQRQVFFDPYHEVANMTLKEMIETGLDRGVLTVDDLFKTDREVLGQLRTIDDFSKRLDAIGPDMAVTRGCTDPDYVITRKRRTMDPIVQNTGERITDSNPDVNRTIENFHANVPLEQRYGVSFPV